MRRTPEGTVMAHTRRSNDYLILADGIPPFAKRMAGDQPPLLPRCPRSPPPE